MLGVVGIAAEEICEIEHPADLFSAKIIHHLNQVHDAIGVGHAGKPRLPILERLPRPVPNSFGLALPLGPPHGRRDLIARLGTLAFAPRAEQCKLPAGAASRAWLRY